MKLKNFRRVAALGMAVGMTAVLAPAAIPLTPPLPRPLNLPPRRLTPPRRPALRPRTPSTPIWLISAFPMRLTRTVISRRDRHRLCPPARRLRGHHDQRRPGPVSDDDINDYIDSNVLSNFATTNEVKDRAAADGDTVNIDYVGRIDGVAFDGGDTKAAAPT